LSDLLAIFRSINIGGSATALGAVTVIAAKLEADDATLIVVSVANG